MSDTMLPQIIARLQAVARELEKLADNIRWYVPKQPGPDNPFLEAWNRTGGASGEVRRAVTNIKEGMQR